MGARVGTAAVVNWMDSRCRHEHPVRRSEVLSMSPKFNTVLMVAFLFPPEFGGAIVQALRLSRELKLQGQDVHFLVDSGGRPSGEFLHDDVRVLRRSTGELPQRSMLRQLLWALRLVAFALAHPDYRVYHFHSVRGPELLAMPLLRLLGRRTIYKITLAGSDDPQTLGRRRLMGGVYRWLLRQITQVIAISPKLRDMAIAGGIDPARVVLVPNGVAPERFHPASSDERARLRRHFGWAADERVLLTVGSIEHRKGMDTLLQAFAQVRAQLAGCRLVIVGPGNDEGNPFYVELQAWLAGQGVQGVDFVGERDDVADRMRAADLFVFCSRQEGLPNVLLEALCCGLPVVAMDIEGITGWVLEGRTIARNLPDRDPARFADACLELLGRTDRPTCEAAAHAAAQDFGMDTIARRYRQIYAEL